MLTSLLRYPAKNDRDEDRKREGVGPSSTVGNCVPCVDTESCGQFSRPWSLTSPRLAIGCVIGLYTGGGHLLQGERVTEPVRGSPHHVGPEIERDPGRAEQVRMSRQGVKAKLGDAKFYDPGGWRGRE